MRGRAGHVLWEMNTRPRDITWHLQIQVGRAKLSYLSLHGQDLLDEDHVSVALAPYVGRVRCMGSDSLGFFSGEGLR